MMLQRFFVFLPVLFVALISASAGAADHFDNQIAISNPPRAAVPLTFQDERGATRSLDDYRGQMVLLSIWATWCTPCVKEMPSLDGLQAKFGADRLIVLPIIEDREGLTAARTFYDRHQLTHLPVLADTAGHAPAALHVRGLPTTLLLGPDGRELARVEGGADWLSPEAVAFLQAQMKPR